MIKVATASVSALLAAAQSAQVALEPVRMEAFAPPEHPRRPSNVFQGRLTLDSARLGGGFHA